MITLLAANVSTMCIPLGLCKICAPIFIIEASRGSRCQWQW